MRDLTAGIQWGYVSNVVIIKLRAWFHPKTKFSGGTRPVSMGQVFRKSGISYTAGLPFGRLIYS